MSENPQKPEGYESDLSDFKACIFDGYCGEPIAWGFKILKRLPKDRFENLRNYGELECVQGGGYSLNFSWFLVTKRLNREEAEKKYGSITNEEFGPKGGWKSVTFGDKKFIAKSMKKTE